MAGKQAKIIAEPEIAAVLRYVRARRHGTRNVVMVLLSTKAGLRACEIARLTWSMVLAALLGVVLVAFGIGSFFTE